MSTFKGVVTEFPEIRIDYFRKSTDPKAKAPLACFLSHVHSDHIQGLDGPYNSPFVYCSAATKELLVRLERRVHRLNFQKGIVESHDCKYKDKKTLLKTVPLETPTWVELGLQKKLRITLFDANHCVGAVMFLIEGDEKSILYTGDIRAEDWWVEYLKRHPVLVPYTTGMKHLDKIYLDTSWGWRGYDKFTSKCDGVQELLDKLFKYPDDTIFHLNTWTFGYEDVWVALAAAFKSKIHLNPYLFRLYMSIKQPDKWTHGPFLCGFDFGNTTQPPVITTNPQVRFHSCERGLKCPGLESDKVVYITPIIARIGDEEFNEEGIDYGDLNNSDDFPLYGQVKVLLDVLGPTLPSNVKHMLIDASKSRKPSVPLGNGSKEIPLQDFINILTEVARTKAKGGKFKGDQNWPGTTSIKAGDGEFLPTWIKFPYSRHSCLPELRNLVGAFRPKDIHPCVLEEVHWNEKNSVENIYGDLCSERIFAHDVEMRKLYTFRVQEEQEWEDKVEEMAEESQTRLDRGETQYLERLEARLLRQNYKTSNMSLPLDTFHPPLSSSPPPPGEFILLQPSVRLQSPKAPRTPIRKRSISIASTTPSDLSSEKDLQHSVETQLLNESFCMPPPPLPHLPPTGRPPTSGRRTLHTRPLSPNHTKRKKVSSTIETRPESIIEPDYEGGIVFKPARTLVDLPPFTHEITKELCAEPAASLIKAEVEDAIRAACEWKGDSWWNIELQSTERKWRYEAEEEL